MQWWAELIKREREHKSCKAKTTIRPFFYFFTIPAGSRGPRTYSTRSQWKALCWVSYFGVILHFIVQIFLHCIVWTQAQQIILSSLTISAISSLGVGGKRIVIIFFAHTGVKWVCSHKRKFLFLLSCPDMTTGRARARLRLVPVRSPWLAGPLLIASRCTGRINYRVPRLLSPPQNLSMGDRAACFSQLCHFSPLQESLPPISWEARAAGTCRCHSRPGQDR